MFFDHTASQLSNVKKVKRIRNQVKMRFLCHFNRNDKKTQIICNLEDYVADNCQYTGRGRLGEILCLIPTLQSIRFLKDLIHVDCTLTINSVVSWST